MTELDRERNALGASSADAPSLAVVTGDARTGVVLRRALEARGWEVTWMHDPRALLRRGDAQRHEALLAIIDHAETDALEMLAALAAQPESPPVILLTRLAAAASLGPSVLGALGVARLLPWPSRLDPIAAALDEVCSRSRATAAAVAVEQQVVVSP